jgi:hypothetical protein
MGKDSNWFDNIDMENENYSDIFYDMHGSLLGQALLYNNMYMAVIFWSYTWS